MLTDKENFEKAIKFAEEVHKNQIRDDGSPYFTHIDGVVKILKDEFGVTSYKILTVAALHDVIEDSNYTKEDLSLKFGECIAKMVSALSKTKGIRIEEYFKQIDNMKNIENNSTWRIKMADRIYNIRDLENIMITKPEKVKRYINETEEHFLKREIDIEPEYKELLEKELKKIKEKI